VIRRWTTDDGDLLGNSVISKNKQKSQLSSVEAEKSFILYTSYLFSSSYITR
jgi:hypothetical protein